MEQCLCSIPPYRKLSQLLNLSLMRTSQKISVEETRLGTLFSNLSEMSMEQENGGKDGQRFGGTTSFWGYGRSLQAVGWPEVLFIAAFLILLVTESVTVWCPGMNSHLTVGTSFLKP